MADHTMIEVKQVYEDLYARYGDDLTRFATGWSGRRTVPDFRPWRGRFRPYGVSGGAAVFRPRCNRLV